MSTTATTHTPVPAQRGPRQTENPDLTALSDLLILIQDEIASGAAGTDAAAEVTQREDQVTTTAALLREFRDGNATGGVRLARLTDAAVALVEAVRGVR